MRVEQIIFKVDPEGKIYKKNRDRFFTLKANPENIYSIFPFENLKSLKTLFDDFFDNGKSYELTLGINLPNNSHKWAVCRLVPDLEENSSYGLFIMRDITDKQNSRDELIKKEAHLSGIINNTSDIILSINKNYELLEFNHVLIESVKRGFGFELKRGMNVFDIIQPSQHEEVKCIYDRVLKGECFKQVDLYNTSKGTIEYHEVSYNPIHSNGDISGIAIFSQNITRRINREEKLKSTLKEKEVLLAEVHHRVKNNLAVVSSLLQIETFNSRNNELIATLNDCVSRIKTMALVHEKIYKNDSLAYIEFKQYAHDLIQDIYNSQVNSQNSVKVDIDVDCIKLDIEMAVPCALLINEVITNSFKHAFSQKSDGEISIRFKNQERHLSLIIEDNGSGFPDHVDFTKSDSKGLELIKTFVDQLEGELKVDIKNKTKYEITFQNSVN